MATLEALLASRDKSVRLSAALKAGTYPILEQIDILVSRCAIEPDFFVRDTLSWALLMHDRASVVERLQQELKSEIDQARSQAIHTFTKIDDEKFYPLITHEMLYDSNDIVAMTAWRAAARLAPEHEKVSLAKILFTQLGRGNYELRFALSRALVELGDVIREPLGALSKSDKDEVRLHADFTLKILSHPELVKEFALDFEISTI